MAYKRYLLATGLFILLCSAMICMRLDIIAIGEITASENEGIPIRSWRTKFHSSPREKKKRHFYFLKTPKCGSSTIITLLFERFGYQNNVTFLLPSRVGFVYFEKILRNIQALKGKQSEMFVRHSVYNRAAIEKILPKDTVYIGLVREPLAHFISSFIYFKYKAKLDFMVQMPGKDVNGALSWYLNNTAKYRTKHEQEFRYLNNMMAFSFGFPTVNMQKVSVEKIDQFLRKLDAEFDLVIVLEYFDESLVLMKRLMSWSTKDIIYIQQLNMAVKDKDSVRDSLTDGDRLRHKQLEYVDFAIYNHFMIRLLKKIHDEGISFQRELEDYRAARSVASQFCEHHKPNEELQYITKNLKEEIKINSNDCDFMKLNGKDIWKLVIQTKRYTIVPVD